jgi:hypothetical protein
MEKRGISQVFYYIFAVIVISLIFLFGYQQIIRLQGLNEKANFAVFKNDFQDAVKNIYYKNPGSIITYSINSANKPLILPKDVKKICFKKINNNSEVKADSKYFITFVVDNLIPEQGVNLKLENNEYCSKITDSKFSFTLENKVINQQTLIYIK